VSGALNDPRFLPAVTNLARLAEAPIHRVRREYLRERLRAWFTSQGDSVFVKK